MIAAIRPVGAPKSAFAGASVRLGRPQRAIAARKAVTTQALFTKTKKVTETYVCRVCGYTHTDGELPSKCPECGFPKMAFRKEEPVQKVAAKGKGKGKAAEEAPKKKLFGLF